MFTTKSVIKFFRQIQYGLKFGVWFPNKPPNNDGIKEAAKHISYLQCRRIIKITPLDAEYY